MKTLKQEIDKLEVSDFCKQCYLSLIKVPAGKITTYQKLAESIGSKAYRAVGTAMAKNPLAPNVPCHRVINSSGKIGNYAFGINKKIKLLKSEGIQIKANKVVESKKYLFEHK